MTDTPVMSLIGMINARGDAYEIRLDEAFRPGLVGLAEFSHAHVLWWADRAASVSDRARLICEQPYTRSNADVGVFASRSPERPNPIGISVVAMIEIDADAGRIVVPFIDTLPGTPVLDIKPYFPASDRVRDAPTGRHTMRHRPASTGRASFAERFGAGNA